MNSLASLHVIGVKGLFHGHWLGTGWQHHLLLALQLREGQTRKSRNLPSTICELLAILAGFLDSAQAEPYTPSFPGEQFHCFSADPG
jgi:hypothetical protein